MPKLGRADGVAIGTKVSREEALPWILDIRWRIRENSQGGVLRAALCYAMNHERDFIYFCLEQKKK